MSKHEPRMTCMRCGNSLYGECVIRECGNCTETDAAFIPTLGEIASVCRQIQNEWSPQEELAHRVIKPIPFTIPFIKFKPDNNVAYEFDFHPEPDVA